MKAASCKSCWPNKKVTIYQKNGFLLKLVCFVSEKTHWADGCHIRWPGSGVSVILLRCAPDIFLGGPTSCTTAYLFIRNPIWLWYISKSDMKSNTRNPFSPSPSFRWYLPLYLYVEGLNNYKSKKQKKVELRDQLESNILCHLTLSGAGVWRL